MTIEDLKSTVGYSEDWSQFLDESFFKAQLNTFLSSSDEDVDHYKWAAYKEILENHDLSKEREWKGFVQLINNDSNDHLFKGAISELIESGKLSKTSLRKCKSTKILSFKKVQDFINEYT